MPELLDKEMNMEQVRMCNVSLIILDNVLVLTVGESAEGEEAAGQLTVTQETPRRSRGCVCEKSHNGGLCHSVPAVV
jgi:hypothetical protein